MHESDPIGAWLRDTRAQRRVGRVPCACGEARPFALITGRSPPLCHRCERRAHGRKPYEDNHVFGKRNGSLMIRYPVNDHRAILSVAQYHWPPETLENSEGDPFLAAAARFRGLYDNIKYMLDNCVEEAQRLEQLSKAMRQKYGRRWWSERLEAEPSGSTCHRPASRSRRSSDNT
jgi:hypothetical protein